MRTTRPTPARGRRRGASLIQMLVALAVLAALVTGTANRVVEMIHSTAAAALTPGSATSSAGSGIVSLLSPGEIRSPIPALSIPDALHAASSLDGHRLTAALLDATASVTGALTAIVAAHPVP